jgi:cysteinyl-tRNA synthetase
MLVHDTLSAEKVELVSREPGKVALYICGPTVYDVPHVGHARSTLSFDAIRRALGWRGFDVTHVSSVTDVDDKIINKARTEGSTEPEVAARYEAIHWTELDRLGIKRPHEVARATAFIPQMLDTVATLMSSERAYATESGIYFSVASFPSYFDLKK